MDKTLRNILIASIVIITLSVIYYIFIYIPRIEIDKQKKISEEIQIRKKCEIDAVDRTIDLLIKKNELRESDIFSDAISKVYSEEDFNNFYEQCLSFNGLEK